MLHSFGAAGDGAYPFAGLVMNRDGVLFGTTLDGGAYGGGTLFKFSQSLAGPREVVLHNFGSGIDGSHPTARLTRDNNTGSLFGMTYEGGARGFGAVFQLTP